MFYVVGRFMYDQRVFACQCPACRFQADTPAKVGVWALWRVRPPAPKCVTSLTFHFHPQSIQKYRLVELQGGG
eukprot:1485979-Pyramimonas_sp.AAC.1